jgi:AcrR family transcriptional regulator
MTEAKPSLRKQITKETIVDAAYRLFSRKGYSGTTTREIAEQAGVNELTLFRHFRNKLNLLSQVILQHATEVRLEKILEGTEKVSFEEGFHQFARAFLILLEEKYPIIRLMIIEATSNPELKAIVGPIPMKLRGILIKHLERGVREGRVREDLDLELVAQSFLWIFMSYVMTRSDVGAKFCPFPPEDVARASTEIFLRGLQPIR